MPDILLKWDPRCVYFAGLVLASVAALLSPASADDQTETYRYRASGFGGALIPQSQSFSGSGALSGLPFAANGKLSSNTGETVGLLLGYSFEDTPGWEWFNIDLTAGYVSSTFDHFSGDISITGAGGFSGDTPLAGNFHTYAGFMNFLATPFGVRHLAGGKITPFIGGGPGVARSTASLKSFNFAGSVVPVGVKSTETDFAADGTFGLDYALTPQWDLGIAYQYTWIDTKHLGSGAGLVANTGSSSAHAIGLVLEYRFGQR